MIPLVETGETGKNSIAANIPPIPIIGNSNAPYIPIMQAISTGGAYSKPAQTVRNDIMELMRINMY